jgi:hypothetical protein
MTFENIVRDKSVDICMYPCPIKHFFENVIIYKSAKTVIASKAFV